MTVKLFGVNTLKTYYEAPHEADVLRWAIKSFKGTSVYAVEGERMLPEPMMIYDDHKNYREIDIETYQTYQTEFKLDIKAWLTRTNEDGLLVKKGFTSRRKAMNFLHVGEKRLRRANGNIIKGWRVNLPDE